MAAESVIEAGCEQTATRGFSLFDDPADGRMPVPPRELHLLRGDDLGLDGPTGWAHASVSILSTLSGSQLSVGEDPSTSALPSPAPRAARSTRKHVAVLTDMYSVVVQASTLRTQYPGGVDSYAAQCPNRTFCSDGEVCRVGFMSWADVKAFMESLRRFDITLETGTAAIVREDRGLLQPSHWLKFHRIDGLPMGRLVGSALQGFVDPPGWAPGHRNILVTEAHLQRQELVEDDAGVATYRNRTTEEVVYVGRALTRTPSRRPWWRFWKG
jgi:hypothetical protein